MELDSTPFFPQSEYHCGPAALATILAASDIDVVPEQLVAKVYLPARRGSLQLELQGATRSHGRVAYVIEPDLSALVAELQHGRPVLVMQNLGLKAIPIWHYAVVIGYDAPRDQLILRSGTDPLLRLRTRKFLKTWAMSQNWGLIALRPGEPPARIDRVRWLRAITALDRPDRHGLSIDAYSGFLRHFDDDPIALFGLANAHASAAEYRRAERIYRDLLRADPNNVAARNNLAMSLAARACYTAALEEIKAAQRRDQGDSAFSEMLADTRADIDRRLAAGDRQPPDCER